MKKKLYYYIGVVVVFLLISTLFYALIHYRLFNRAKDQSQVVVLPAVHYEFGIPVDSFHLKTAKLKSGEQLAGIFRQYLSDSAHAKVLTYLSVNKFNTRRLRTGATYNLYFNQLDTAKLAYMVYKESPANAIIFSFLDSFSIHEHTKTVKHIQRTTAGVITSSLWTTIASQQASPDLAMKMADIYAWAIDFFALQKGDNFKIIYDEIMIDSVSLGIQSIKTAVFTHNGKAYYAIPFEQDKQTEYYDLDGNSLKKAFLKAPLKFSRISSAFSHSRFHPVLRIRRPHLGVDYAAPRGTPVHAIGSGTIVQKGFSGGAGNMVKIRHNSIYTTSYMHLQRFATNVGSGSHVSQGQLIGYVGSTGLSSGPHLDFRFYKNGAPVDPLKVEAPPSLPVKPELKAKFDSVKTILVNELQKVN